VRTDQDGLETRWWGVSPSQLNLSPHFSWSRQTSPADESQLHCLKHNTTTSCSCFALNITVQLETKMAAGTPVPSDKGRFVIPGLVNQCDWYYRTPLNSCFISHAKVWSLEAGILSVLRSGVDHVQWQNLRHSFNGLYVLMRVPKIWILGASPSAESEVIVSPHQVRSPRQIQ